MKNVTKHKHLAWVGMAAEVDGSMLKLDQCSTGSGSSCFNFMQILAIECVIQHCLTSRDLHITPN